jgi:hypothetical protein
VTFGGVLIDEFDQTELLGEVIEGSDTAKLRETSTGGFRLGLLTVQPRIRLGRSFDERSHTYLGYALRVHGSIGGERGPRISHRGG